MRGNRQIILAVAAMLLAITSVAASASHAAVPRIRHQLSVTSAGRTVEASGGASESTAPPTLKLSTRSRVWFTVARKTLPLPFFSSMPRGAGRYAAFYFPDVEQGWALMPDAGSTLHWPAVLPFGSGFGFVPLLPGRVYSVDVAVEHRTRVQMPFPMHVVKVRPASFKVTAVIHPVSMATPVSVAVADSATDSLGNLPLSTTAIAVDWKSDAAPVEDDSGDACPSASQTMSCSGSANLSYTEGTQELGPAGGPHQEVMGEAFDSPDAAPYISAYAVCVPTPLNAATIYGFAMVPPSVLRG
jgi:hypothetical protein